VRSSQNDIVACEFRIFEIGFLADGISACKYQNIVSRVRTHISGMLYKVDQIVKQYHDATVHFSGLFDKQRFDR
jgi:hypothetical protein